jgi:hypothetical protein
VDANIANNCTRIFTPRQSYSSYGSLQSRGKKGIQTTSML